MVAERYQHERVAVLKPMQTFPNHNKQPKEAELCTKVDHLVLKSRIRHMGLWEGHDTWCQWVGKS